MEIRNRLFPYPVLCNDNDDYIDSTFVVNCKCTEELSDLVLDFDIDLKNNEKLQRLIRDGFAEYVIHIECSSTAFRTILEFSGNQSSYRISKSRINNEIALLGMIVAVKNISSYASEQLNEDYSGELISFDRGSILAYYNIPKIYVIKNYEELSGGNTLFTIVKKINTDPIAQEPVSYDIGDSKIKILVDENVYNKYITYYTNPNMEAIISSLLIMPALIYMIESLRNEGVDGYRSLSWYQAISKSCKLQGKDFEDDFIYSEKTSVEIAQDMLKLPINRGFESISNILEG